MPPEILEGMGKEQRIGLFFAFKVLIGAPWWPGGLKIQCCACSNSSFIPCPRLLHAEDMVKKKKKKKERKKEKKEVLEFPLWLSG